MPRSFSLSRWPSVASALTVILAGVCLAGWMTQDWALASLGSQGIMMAPSTGLAFVLLGLALFVRTRSPGFWSPWAVALGLGAAFPAVLVLGAWVVGGDSWLDGLVSGTNASWQGMAVGRMSPITAGLLLVTAGALGTRGLNRATLGSAFVLSVGFFLTVGYWYQAPLFYQAPLVPPALPTALGLFVLNLGTFLLVAPRSAVASRLFGDALSVRLVRMVVPLTLGFVLVDGWMDREGVTLAPNPALAQLLGAFVLGAVLIAAIVWQTRKVSTEIHDMTQQLRESEFFVRETQRIGRVGTYRLDFRTGRWESSPVLDQIFGIDEQYNRSVEGWVDLIDPLDRERMNRYLEDEVIGPHQPFHQEYRIVRKTDGEVRWVNGRGELGYDQGQLASMSGTIQDVTERRNSEAALRESESRLRTALENAPFPIMIHADDGQVELVNTTWSELSGYSAVEIPTIEAWTTLAYGDRAPSVTSVIQSSYLRPGKKDEGEFQIRTKDGRMLTWDFSTASAGVLSDGRRAVISMARDVTEQRQVEESLVRAQKLESLGVLAGGIAHDFNNLLAAIFGFIDLAHRKSRDEEVSKFLAKARHPLERAKGLTQQLLTFAKGGAPNRELQPLSPFLEDTARFVLSGSAVDVVFHIGDDLWPCQFDRSQIGQVIENLVINALQAMPAGGTIEISVSNFVRDGRFLRISVKDQGTGIPSETLGRIFDPFYTTKASGHGLGLAICHSILRRHDGWIDVESTPGRGTTFHVSLPASEVLGTVDPTPGSDDHWGTGDVLVMDDAEDVREMTGSLLEAFGYTPVCFANGTDAAAFVADPRKARRWKAMILDLTVPGGWGGKDIVAAIRAHHPTLPIFVASGYAEDPIVADPQAYGFTASLPKPFSGSELARLFNLYLPAKPG